MKQQTVQDVVRASEHITNKKARCFRDTSYTKTERKVRFKFITHMTMTPQYRERVANDLRQDLEAAGHEVDNLLVVGDEILVYQRFPITIIEG